ncbi:hypothetical protein SODALDRAFT_378219 [Sodiomyces alkalinus F11]|uniref:Uncharacterized protein n=1 Tax=Sodiomyces alkalinus (strain CBS 110278 / VKM F-3762 / F11) TaxID=1314773 RepID=A0A3N2PXG1_SODAK|nr:hypothetical protein SODALDRAFT_378219 [Sodiomyces alkalinus F11]ROT39106.1 hypothetical protein SODALDRAFT_378219 [Sodiomyces alkalinus F11]
MTSILRSVLRAIASPADSGTKLDTRNIRSIRPLSHTLTLQTERHLRIHPFRPGPQSHLSVSSKREEGLPEGFGTARHMEFLWIDPCFILVHVYCHEYAYKVQRNRERTISFGVYRDHRPTRICIARPHVERFWSIRIPPQPISGFASQSPRMPLSTSFFTSFVGVSSFPHNFDEIEVRCDGISETVLHFPGREEEAPQLLMGSLLISSIVQPHPSLLSASTPWHFITSASNWHLTVHVQAEAHKTLSVPDNLPPFHLPHLTAVLKRIFFSPLARPSFRMPTSADSYWFSGSLRTAPNPRSGKHPPFHRLRALEPIETVSLLVSAQSSVSRQLPNDFSKVFFHFLVFMGTSKHMGPSKGTQTSLQGYDYAHGRNTSDARETPVCDPYANSDVGARPAQQQVCTTPGAPKRPGHRAHAVQCRPTFPDPQGGPGSARSSREQPYLVSGAASSGQTTSIGFLFTYMPKLLFSWYSHIYQKRFPSTSQ